MDLVEAVKTRYIKRVRELLDSGVVDVDFQDEYGKTALMFAAAGELPRVRDSGIHQPDMVELLLEEYGADPDIRDNDGNTALILAARSDRERADIVLLLLEYGADPNIRDNAGKTALMFATKGQCTAIVILLLDWEANANIRDNNGRSALDMTLPWQKYVKKLLERHVRSSIIQRRFRDRQNQRKKKTQKAYQKLAATHIPGLDNVSLIKASEYLDKMQYPDEQVESLDGRRREEENERDQNELIADYLKTLEQYGGRRNRRLSRKRRTSRKKNTRRKTQRQKNTKKKSKRRRRKNRSVRKQR